MRKGTSQITRLLKQWGDGDREALNEVIPRVYDRLHEIAHARLRRGPSGRSLNTTSLVHEAYVRLADLPRGRVRDRGHFLALAARVMRYVLVDHARARAAAKRGGGLSDLPIQEELWVSEDHAGMLLEVDQAMKRLEALNPRHARILEQRYFGGLSLEETAEAMGLSLATVKRDLRSARAWLALQLGNGS